MSYSPTESPKPIDLLPLLALDPESQRKVREIRNEPNVRRWMYTDHLIGVDEHLKWIDRLRRDDTQIVFVVTDEARVPLGVVSVNALDRRHRKADWAFYLTEHARGGLGSALEYAFINFVFDALDVDKLNCEVIEGNDPVVRLHQKFLFEEEGFRRSNLEKNGARIGVHFLGLTKEDWRAGEEKIRERYRSVFERFSISIHWQSEKEEEGPYRYTRAA